MSFKICFDYFATVAPPGGFFTSIKMISHITFKLRSIDFVILSLIIPEKVTITKIHHLIRLNFERSEHKKSQCAPQLTIAPNLAWEAQDPSKIF